MVSNGTPQSVRNVFSLQSNGAAGNAGRRFGRQDNVRIASVRDASAQPVADTKRTRTKPLGSNGTRTRSAPTPKTQRVLVGLWVKPRVREELQRISQTEGISLSATGAALLEQAVQHSLSATYAPLLEPIIRSEIQQGLRANSARIAWLLVRVAFDTGQTRSLVANILGRQPGVTDDVLKTIKEMSQRSAKGNLTRRSPQLTELLNAVEKWLGEGDEEEGTE